MDFSIVIDSLADILAGFLSQLPQIVLGLIILILFLFAARLVSGVVNRGVSRYGLSNQAALAMGRIGQWMTVILGILIAMTIIFPSVDPATLLGTLGIGGVAISFAFGDILQNFFAGLILLLSEPFRIGDQIEVNEFSGTVKRIETRATTLHTFDGRVVIIPNAELFTNSVTVNTAHEKRRSEYDVGIGYGDDVAEAKRIILEVMPQVEGVLAQPAPEAFVIALASSTINIRVRWWTEPRIMDVLHVQDRVLVTIAETLHAAGVDLPFPTQQILFHDQTEETDGDRTRQREGWPAPKNGAAPRPRRINAKQKDL